MLNGVKSLTQNTNQTFMTLE